MSFIPLRIHRNRCRLGLCPRPHWGSLQRSPDPVAGFMGAASQQDVNEGGRREEGKGSERGNGEGRGKGKVGGLAPWLLGDRRPCTA